MTTARSVSLGPCSEPHTSAPRRGMAFSAFCVRLVSLAVLLLPARVAAADVPILTEDFEDAVLDPKISIETAGEFAAEPDIRTQTNFGSTRAFGCGRST